MRRLLLTLAALSLAASASAQVDHHEKFDDGWVVTKYERLCSAVRQYETGDLVSVSYVPEMNSVTILFTDQKSTSLRDDQEVDLYIHLLSRDYSQENLGRKAFEVIRDEGFPPTFVVNLGEGREILKHISKHELIVFTIEPTEKTVGSYFLDGSARAIASMKECSFEAAGLNEDDPFLN